MIADKKDRAKAAEHQIAAVQARQKRERMAQEAEQQFQDSINIQKLTEKHPEAGNIFTPGASIFEDALFIDAMSRLGLGKVEEKDGKPTLLISDEDQAVMRENMDVRKTLKQLIKQRVRALVSENPAGRIQNHYDAYKKVDSHFSPHGVSHSIGQGDSLNDYVFTEARTVANMLVPEGVRSNRNKVSYKLHRRSDDPANMGSHDYVTNLAYDMLANDFDYGKNDSLVDERKYIDPHSKVLLHSVGIAQHRTAAHIVTYGSV